MSPDSILNSLIQRISIFPMLGMLGTVFGLMPALQEVRDGIFDKLYDSMSTALLTTVAGLCCAIVLKLYVAKKTSRISYEIESTFDETDRQYNMLLNFSRIMNNNK